MMKDPRAPHASQARRGHPAGGPSGQRVTGCTSGTCSSARSAAGNGWTSRWARAPRCSSAATARARPTWSRRSATSPPWAATGSPPTRRWCGTATPRRSCGRRCAGATGSCWSRSRSTRAGPTGCASTGRRCRGRGSCWASSARCCSRPRTSPWCGATRPSGGASSTSCWSPAPRGWPASGPTTTGCSSSATPC